MFEKITVQRKIVFGYIFILSILAVVTYISYNNISQMSKMMDTREGHIGVNHTYKVIASAKELVKLLIDMESGMRGFVITGNDDFLEPYNAAQKVFEGKISKLQHTVSDNPPQQRKLASVLKVENEWKSKIVNKVLKLRRQVSSHTNESKVIQSDKLLETGSKVNEKNGDTVDEHNNGSLEKHVSMNDVIAFVNKGLGKTYMDKMRVQLKAFTDIEEDLLKKRIEKQNESSEQSLYLTLITAGIGLVLGVIISFILTRSISKPLKNTVYMLKESSENLNSGAGQIKESSEKLAEAASQQASALEQSSASLEEISSMTQNNTEIAENSYKMTTNTYTIVERSNQSMQKLTEAINGISKSGKDTVQIIKVIDDIAFQTNLLALNAAVEAARAGEAGMGFAVVADEVRSLAQRSAEAAKTTSQLIEDATQQIEDGFNLTKMTENDFKELMGIITQLKQLMEELAASSKEQSVAIEQISDGVQNMTDLTQSNAANSEETASIGVQVTERASELSDIVKVLTRLVGDTEAAKANSLMLKNNQMSREVIVTNENS